MPLLTELESSLDWTFYKDVAPAAFPISQRDCIIQPGVADGIGYAGSRTGKWDQPCKGCIACLVVLTATFVVLDATFVVLPANVVVPRANVVVPSAILVVPRAIIVVLDAYVDVVRADKGCTRANVPCTSAYCVVIRSLIPTSPSSDRAGP